MKIKKTPYDFFSFYFYGVLNLFLMASVITFRHIEVTDLTEYLFLSIFAGIFILQIYSIFVLKTFRKGVQRYGADGKQLYPNSFLSACIFMFLPTFILLFLKWKLPSSSESTIWTISLIGILYFLYLININLKYSFNEDGPILLVIDFKKHLTFIQRGFLIKLEKEKIKYLNIDLEEKSVRIKTDKERIFKMPFYLHPTLELMRLNFLKENPHWFIDN